MINGALNKWYKELLFLPMNITLKSTVVGELKFVVDHFDQNLFKYLLPPGAHLIKFGGSKTGDVVHLHLPLAGEWISEITEHYSDNHHYYFIDEGRKLPFPLKKWHHKHILRSKEGHTVIEDHMSFSTGLMFSDMLFYPLLFFSFMPRFWQYKNYFKSLHIN